MSPKSLGFKNNLALTPDGPQFRKIRKAYGNFLSKSASLSYRDAQERFAGIMVGEIEKEPERWKELLSRYVPKPAFKCANCSDSFETFGLVGGIADRTM